MSGSVKLKLPAGGSKTISAPDSASDETITLPAGNQTVATQAQVNGLGGRKNLLINGDMRISQRGTTFNPVANSTGIYTIDRFCTQSSQSNNFTITQDPSSPPGFLNNWKITMGTATTLDYTRLCATVEGYHFKQASAFGTSLAKHLTLSFWVKSSLTGTFGIGFRNGTTIGGAGLSTSLLSTYTINSANTWEYKTITIPPNTEATWGLSNNTGFIIIWDLGDSNTRSSSVTNTWQTSDVNYPVGLTNGTKVASVTGATWQITGVQLEVGSVATDFEHRSYGEELALCQRYYEQSYTQLSGSDGKYNAVASTGSNYLQGPTFRVTKRAQPTMAAYDGIHTLIGGATSLTIGSFDHIGINGALRLSLGGSGRVDGQIYRYHWSADAEL